MDKFWKIFFVAQSWKMILVKKKNIYENEIYDENYNNKYRKNNKYLNLIMVLY